MKISMNDVKVVLIASLVSVVCYVALYLLFSLV